MAKGSKEIRRRIRSVRNTQQITKAMKMVAAARLRKSEGRTQASRPYTDTLRQVMARLSGASAEVDHPFLRHIAPDVPRVMLVLFTSDKGLCGSFNTSLLKKAEEFIREQRALGREVVLVTVGRKGQQYFRRRGTEPSAHFASFTNKSTYSDLRPLGTLLTNAYTSANVSEVYMVYARFVSVAKNLPRAVRLLPVETPKVAAGGGRPSVAASEDSAQGRAPSQGFRQEFTLEPSPEALLVALLPRYFQTVLFQAAIENFTSENGARMVAMENATKAAGDMIKSLTLEYNKARQAGITLELLDIVGGAEALKG